MQIGWREFIKGRFKRASKFLSVGIELGVNDLHISTLQKIKGKAVWVKQHGFSINNWEQDLKEYVDKHDLANTQCSLVLSISKYQMLQLDKPAVEDSELLQALQWSVKEQLSNDDELAIDYFDRPANTASSKKLNVVVINKQDVVTIRNGVLQAGLSLNTIGVEELAICNLVRPSDDAVISLKQETGGQLSLNIIKQSKLYFSRRLRGYENLASFSPEELKMGVVDNLSLEIQRSMDYFESQLRQAPVKKVYLCLDTLHQDALAELIKQTIFIAVEPFVPNIDKEQALPLTPASCASLGAAIENVGLVV